MEPTKCIAVIGGTDYEGQSMVTLRLFDCQSAADAYKAELERDYDYVLMEVKEISQKSMFLS
jgi:hypothetical protein